MPNRKFKYFLGWEIKNYKSLFKNISEETNTILTSPNAGGNSVRSEAYAFEWLYRYKNARKVVTENDVVYFHVEWKKVDFITTIGSYNYGISVTRVLPFKQEDYDNLDEFVSRLLYKKLNGLVIARTGVSEEHSFESSILFCWCPSVQIKELTHRIFKKSKLLNEGVELITMIAPRYSLLKDFRFE